MDATPVALVPVYDARLNWVGLRLEGRPLPLNVVARLAERLEADPPFPSPLVFLPFDPSSPAPPYPPERTVLVLPAPPEGAEAENCRSLRAQGVHIAAPGLSPLDGLVDIAMLPVAAAQQETLLPALEGEFRLFATEADSPELIDWCASAGFHFIACRTMAFRPAPKGRAQSPSRLLLMKLLELVTRDAETWELEHIFKQEPRLAFDLLRLVNSASMGLRTKISSFGQAIAILGRRQLQRWLQLLMFAPSKEGGAAAGILMQQAATRGRLLELLSGERGDAVEVREQAFLVGLFSLLDVLMSVPLPDLLKSLHLVEPVEQALLHRGGGLGQMLVLAEQLEARDMDGVAQSLDRLGLSPTVFNDAQRAALAWVHQLGVEENP